MKTQFFYPAPVEVVKVTNENLGDVAEWCGGKVAATESRRIPGKMDSYVWVPTPKGSSISWAFPGMFITKRMVVTVKDEMKATFAVFRRDYFSRNYFDTSTDAVAKTWEKFEKQQAKVAPKPAPPKPRATYKSKAELESENLPIITPGVDHVSEEIVAVVDEVLGINPLAVLEDNVDSRLGVNTSSMPKNEFPKFRHNHGSEESCDANDCTTDRYLDGIHIFADKRINTFENPYPHNEENNMDKNDNGVPVLTEEEAAARKEQRNAELFPEPEVQDLTQDSDGVEGDGEPGAIVDLTDEEAIANVKEVFPDAEVLSDDLTDDNSADAFAGGQVLEGGDIVPSDDAS